MNRAKFWGVFIMGLPLIALLFIFGLLFGIKPIQVWEMLMQVKTE